MSDFMAPWHILSVSLATKSKLEFLFCGKYCFVCFKKEILGVGIKINGIYVIDIFVQSSHGENLLKSSSLVFRNLPPNFIIPRSCSRQIIDEEISGVEPLYYRSFLIDTCGAEHVCPYKMWFDNVSARKDPITLHAGKIVLGRADTMVVVSIYLHGGLSLPVPDVLYLGNSECAVLSVGKLTDEGCEVKFNDNECHLYFPMGPKCLHVRVLKKRKKIAIEIIGKRSNELDYLLSKKTCLRSYLNKGDNLLNFCIFASINFSDIQ